MFQLENVVPWGRSFQDYLGMFNLTPKDLNLSILDCAGGPASFNAVMKQQGKIVISCDPIYQFSPEQIEQRIDETYPIIIKGLYENFDQFVWTPITTPEALGEYRLSAMRKFLADFPQGKEEGRYRDLSFPEFPFPDQSFDLAISSHLLFTYSEQFSFSFHLQSILELCRIAKEVRIFPLVENFTSAKSRHLDFILEALTARNYQTNIQKTGYEFQRGGNELLSAKAT
ncbi:MAG: SAM-dependent methyltransferase [Halothece sp.]